MVRVRKFQRSEFLTPTKFGPIRVKKIYTKYMIEYYIKWRNGRQFDISFRQARTNSDSLESQNDLQSRKFCEAHVSFSYRYEIICYGCTCNILYHPLYYCSRFLSVNHRHLHPNLYYGIRKIATRTENTPPPNPNCKPMWLSLSAYRYDRQMGTFWVLTEANLLTLYVMMITYILIRRSRSVYD